MSAMVAARDLEFAYPARAGSARSFALRDLSFAVEAGEVVSVIGPNGSGKTTLVRLLSGVLRADRGALRLDGYEMGGLSRTEIARRVAVVPQDVPGGFPYTVQELVLMGRFPHAPGRFFETADDRAAAGHRVTS